MNIIPAPMKIAQGEPFAYDFTVSGQDWTGWTGTAKFKSAPKAVTRSNQWFTGEEEPILEVSVTADATGLVQVGLSAAQTAVLPALPVLGYRKTAVGEVSLTNGTDVKKYQVRVLVAAQI